MVVGLVQNSDEVRYSELKIYVHNIYVNGKDRFPNTISSSLNVFVYTARLTNVPLNWKGGKRLP